MNKSWKELIVWEESHKLVLELYAVLKNFPQEELYGLTSQIKRAASSVSINIVEGHSRQSSKEFLRFLYISRGSLEEVRYLLLLSKDLGFLKQEKLNYYEQKLTKISKLLNGLIKSLIK